MRFGLRTPSWQASDLIHDAPCGDSNSDHLLCWCLAGGGPIRGRKSDVPKVRCRPLELDCNLCRASQLLFREYHTAVLLFPAEHVLQNKPLIRCNVGCQGDQCAVSIDRQCVCPFIEGWAFLWQSVNDNRNAQREPLAASFARPWSWLTELLLRHDISA